MNYKNLSVRLQKVASFVPHNAILADIGSDHAYLPCHLAKNEKIQKAIAGEVVKGPFLLAKQHVDSLQLSHKIDVRLADGLMAIENSDKVDTITICGMGGDLIARILNNGYDNHKLHSMSTLILQPNVDEYNVRYWLMTHGYKIVDEVIIEENQKIYEIIVAKFNGSNLSYTENELLFGVFLPLHQSPVFIKKWQKEIEKYEKVIHNLKQSKQNQENKINMFQQKINQIKGVVENVC